MSLVIGLILPVAFLLDPDYLLETLTLGLVPFILFLHKPIYCNERRLAPIIKPEHTKFEIVLDGIDTSTFKPNVSLLSLEFLKPILGVVLNLSQEDMQAEAGA